MTDENLDQVDDLTPEAAEALEESKETGRIPFDIDDDTWYSEQVGKRIKKEVGKRKELQGRLERKETEAEQYKRELKEARDRLAALESKEDEGLKSKVEELDTRAKEALDQGEMAEYHKLNRELVRAELELTTRPKKPQPQEAPPKVQDDGMPLSPAASRWIEQNADWLNRDEDRTVTAARIEEQLVTEGYSVKDPELYRELDRRLSRYGQDDEEGLDVTPHRQGALSGVPRDQGSRHARGRNRPLNAADLRNMQRFGFDPNSAKDRAIWLKRNDSPV